MVKKNMRNGLGGSLMKYFREKRAISSGREVIGAEDSCRGLDDWSGQTLMSLPSSWLAWSIP